MEAWALTRLSEVRCRQGLHEQASGSYQQALELFREVADRDGEAEALNGTGENQRGAGHHDKARAFHDSALALTRRTGGKREQDNTFNAVSFDPVTTTKLRVSLQSGQGSAGVIQWVVPSIPSSAGPRR